MSFSKISRVMALYGRWVNFEENRTTFPCIRSTSQHEVDPGEDGNAQQAQHKRCIIDLIQHDMSINLNIVSGNIGFDMSKRWRCQFLQGTGSIISLLNC